MGHDPLEIILPDYLLCFFQYFTFITNKAVSSETPKIRLNFKL